MSEQEGVRTARHLPRSSEAGEGPSCHGGGSGGGEAPPCPPVNTPLLLPRRPVTVPTHRQPQTPAAKLPQSPESGTPWGMEKVLLQNWDSRGPAVTRVSDLPEAPPWSLSPAGLRGTEALRSVPVWSPASLPCRTGLPGGGGLMGLTSLPQQPPAGESAVAVEMALHLRCSGHTPLSPVSPGFTEPQI